MSAQAVRAGSAFVELFADDSKLVRGLRSASAKIKKWASDTQKQMQAFGSGMMNAGRWTLGIAGGIGGGMLAATKQFSDTGDALDKMSARTGMATNALSELGYAAELSGTNIETIEGSVHKMQALMLNAAQGSSAAIDKLNALGLSYDDLKKKSPEDQFMMLVSRLGKIKDTGQRTAMTMEIFGKSASSLIPLIDAGADSIDKMREEARRLGVSMSGEDAKAAADYTDALTRLYNLFKGITNHIGATLAPELAGLVNWFVKGISPIVAWIDANKKSIITIGKWVSIAVTVGAVLIVVGAGIFGLGAVIGTLGTIAAGVFSAIATAITFVGSVLGFLLTPIGLITAAVVGISGYFLYEFGIIGDGIEYLKQSFGSLFSTATKVWQGIQDALAAGRLDLVFKVAWTAIKLVWTDGVNFLYKQWLWLQNIVLTAWNATVFGLSSLLIKGWVIVNR